MATQTQAAQQPAYAPAPSPVGDLIRKHREKMREVWDRHTRELRSLQRVSGA